jgi:hypothetical protein
MVQIFQADPFLDPLSFDQSTQDIHTIGFSFFFKFEFGPLPFRKRSDTAAGQTYFGQTYFPKKIQGFV